MTTECISTGSRILDELLSGGYEVDVVSTVYGPSGSGKTNLGLICLADVLKKGKKVIFIDTEGGFSLTRLEQILPTYKQYLNNILIVKPTNFAEQKSAFEKLKHMVTDEVGFILVDSISMLYRLELGKTEDIYQINRVLGQQIGLLTEIARKKNIPVLITNQVYASFEEAEKVNMVGGDILKYGSKCLIELEKFHSSKRKAVIKKHRSLPEGKNVMFDIIHEGITGCEQEVPVVEEKEEVKNEKSIVE